MIHLLTAADSREGMVPVRLSRRAMTGPIALTLVLLLGSAGVAFAQDVVITTSGDRSSARSRKSTRTC